MRTKTNGIPLIEDGRNKKEKGTACLCLLVGTVLSDGLQHLRGSTEPCRVPWVRVSRTTAVRGRDSMLYTGVMRAGTGRDSTWRTAGSPVRWLALSANTPRCNTLTFCTQYWICNKHYLYNTLRTVWQDWLFVIYICECFYVLVVLDIMKLKSKCISNEQ